MTAAGALLRVFLEGLIPPQDNSHLQNHARPHLAGKFGGIDGLAVVCPYYFVVTSLNTATSNAISTIPVDDVIEILTC